MKKLLLIFTLIGFVTFTACQEKPKPETMDQTPTLEETLTEANPNDFTVTPLVGELISMDAALKGDVTALTPESAGKMAGAGAMMVFKVNTAYYIVVDKTTNMVVTNNLASLAGKNIALYGTTNTVNGINFFIMDKMEEAK